MTKKIIIPEKLYFKIGDVSKIVGVKPYVLRFWETEFKIINPSKSKTNQRVYKKKDIETILEIKNLLYEDRYTIEGARKKLKELRKAQNNQLKFDFDKIKYRGLLTTLKEELKSIRKHLE